MIANELPVEGMIEVSAQSFILVDRRQRSPQEKATSSTRLPSSNARAVIDAGVFASEIRRVAMARPTDPSAIASGVAAVRRGASSRGVALKLGNTHS